MINISYDHDNPWADGTLGHYQFTSSSNPVHGEVYSIQHYVIKIVSDLRQVIGFLLVLRFPSPMKLTAMI